MPKSPTEYTPITPRSGGLVHATTLRSLYYTACGLEWRGWLITPQGLTCEDCKDALASRSEGTKRARGKRKKVA